MYVTRCDWDPDKVNPNSLKFDPHDDEDVRQVFPDGISNNTIELLEIIVHTAKTIFGEDVELQKDYSFFCDEFVEDSLNLYIKHKPFTITNSKDDKHEIKNLISCFEFHIMNNKIRLRDTDLFKSEVTIQELLYEWYDIINSKDYFKQTMFNSITRNGFYIHSHCSIEHELCYGQSEISYLYDKFSDDGITNEDDITMLFLAFDTFLKWESLEGVPYKSIGSQSFRISRFNNDDLRQSKIHSKKPVLYVDSDIIIDNFIKYILKPEHLDSNLNLNQLGIDCFIEFYINNGYYKNATVLINKYDKRYVSLIKGLDSGKISITEANAIIEEYNNSETLMDKLYCFNGAFHKLKITPIENTCACDKLFNEEFIAKNITLDQTFMECINNKIKNILS